MKKFDSFLKYLIKNSFQKRYIMSNPEPIYQQHDLKQESLETQRKHKPIIPDITNPPTPDSNIPTPPEHPQPPGPDQPGPIYSK